MAAKPVLSISRHGITVSIFKNTVTPKTGEQFDSFTASVQSFYTDKESGNREWTNFIPLKQMPIAASMLEHAYWAINENKKAYVETPVEG